MRDCVPIEGFKGTHMTPLVVVKLCQRRKAVDVINQGKDLHCRASSNTAVAGNSGPLRQRHRLIRAVMKSSASKYPARPFPETTFAAAVAVTSVWRNGSRAVGLEI